MREILFRGMRLDNCNWIIGHLIKYEDGRARVTPSHTDIFCYEKDESIIQTVAHEVYPQTVGQFAGLTDKNGKKIFEGDRCRVSRPCVLAYGKITFQNGCFWFVDDGPGGMLRLCDVKMNGFEIEVIGNTHDNPELLENP